MADCSKDPCEYPALIAKKIVPPNAGGQWTGIQGGVLLSIPPTLGPGFLEMMSPDCFCNWTLEESSDLVAFDRQFRTGPASYAGVYINSGGVLRWNVQGQPFQFHIQSDYAGIITTQRPEPYVAARFYPGLMDRPKSENIRSVSFDVGPPADFGPLVAPNPQNVCFPPHYARTFTIETDIDVIVETVTANGTARQPVIVPSRAAFSCDVWEFVRLTAAANQALPVVSWTGDTEVLL